ncbi:MAG: aconitate hydratase, partial [Clostridiales Family XIII bacterium]|nr:aconitate hydratase [Clostridiales Family XIII bacterium]
ARIHRSNLINSGILPLVFADPADYGKLKEGQTLTIEHARAQLSGETVTVRIRDTGAAFLTRPAFSPTEKTILLAGGRINLIKESAAGSKE